MKEKLRTYEKFLTENSSIEFNNAVVLNKIEQVSDASLNDPDVREIFALFRNIILQHAKPHQSKFFAKMKEIFD